MQASFFVAVNYAATPFALLILLSAALLLFVVLPLPKRPVPNILRYV
jgi:hypothetical protein